MKVWIERRDHRGNVAERAGPFIHRSDEFNRAWNHHCQIATAHNHMRSGIDESRQLVWVVDEKGSTVRP